MGSDRCGIEVKKDTFNSLDQKGRDGVIYDYLDVIYKRIAMLEEKARVDSRKALAIGGVSGFFGGIITVLTYIIAKIFSP